MIGTLDFYSGFWECGFDIIQPPLGCLENGGKKRKILRNYRIGSKKRKCFNACLPGNGQLKKIVLSILHLSPLLFVIHGMYNLNQFLCLSITNLAQTNASEMSSAFSAANLNFKDTNLKIEFQNLQWNHPLE